MSENRNYWLWLSQALGEGAAFKKAIEAFGSVQKLYEANVLEWRISQALTEKQIQRLTATPLTVADEICYSCEQNGWQIIDYDDARYPKRLKEIFNPPAVLYVDGTLPEIDSLAAIGVVGARKASRYAVKATELMSRSLAGAGALIISGGALGVDSAAHRGAIAAGGRTVAVLGCGLGTDYLLENRALRGEIRSHGALVTEYPPFTRASKTTFPMRNRIISGLSVGVLVTEAGVKSGSLITAGHALEQGRDVFALPASVLDTHFQGTNKLIEDGATVATSPHHLLAFYTADYPSLDITRAKTIAELIEEEKDTKNANTARETDLTSFDNLVKGRVQRLRQQETAAGLKGDEQAVYTVLSDTFLSLEEIIDQANLESRKVIAALTQLELKGLVTSASGKRYKQS